MPREAGLSQKKGPSPQRGILSWLTIEPNVYRNPGKNNNQNEKERMEMKA